MKILACFVLAFGIIAASPASRAIEAPKLQGFTSLVEPVRAKQSKAKRKNDQCFSECLNTCFLWWFCTDNCNCECYGKPKGCKMY